MSRPFAAVVLLASLAAACSTGERGHEQQEPEKWSVTAWGERFEIFAECDPFIAGHKAVCATHVTVLDDFSPLRAGSVAAVLETAQGTTEVFSQPQAARDGIYLVEVTPPNESAFDLHFRVDVGGDVEDIEAPSAAGDPPGGEPITFLKEQQWRTEFATAWVAEGSLRESVVGPGRVRPAAGGETILTAPVDAVVVGKPWPYVGQALSRGATAFRLVPRVVPEASLAELEARLASTETELETARRRGQRMEDLLRLEAVSQSEVESARARVATLEAQAAAARKNLDTARSARQGVGGGEGLDVRASFAGRIADVSVTPGQSVAAGEPLGRLVQASPLWIDVAVGPNDAAAIHGGLGGLLVRPASASGPITFAGAEVQLVAKSPEVDPETGRVLVTLAVPGTVDTLQIGSVVDAEILLADERPGVVIPSSAVIDDGGVPIVYLQSEGESFVRREVLVQARQGDVVLVDGLLPMTRLVTRGGAAIRRATLLSSGAGEGHVH